MATYYVYIMTNRTRRLYIGVTNDLCRRVYEHKHRLVPGFTSKYYLERLVYFEDTDDVGFAIARSGRPGKLLPRGPTDPDVRVSRIRLFDPRLRYMTVEEWMRGCGSG